MLQPGGFNSCGALPSPSAIHERAASTFDSAAAGESTISAKKSFELLQVVVEGSEKTLDNFFEHKPEHRPAGDAISKDDFIGLAKAVRRWQREETEQMEVPPDMLGKLKTIFTKMDADGNGTITKKEANAFWRTNFAKVNAGAMFNEVDEDQDGNVSEAEWFIFWKNVLSHGYTAQDLEDELDELIAGGSWVDYSDGRNT